MGRNSREGLPAKAGDANRTAPATIAVRQAASFTTLRFSRGPAEQQTHTECVLRGDTTSASHVGQGGALPDAVREAPTSKAVAAAVRSQAPPSIATGAMRSPS